MLAAAHNIATTQGGACSLVRLLPQPPLASVHPCLLGCAAAVPLCTRATYPLPLSSLPPIESTMSSVPLSLTHSLTLSVSTAPRALRVSTSLSSHPIIPLPLRPALSLSPLLAKPVSTLRLCVCSAIDSSPLLDASGPSSSAVPSSSSGPSYSLQSSNADGFKSGEVPEEVELKAEEAENDVSEPARAARRSPHPSAPSHLSVLQQRSSASPTFPHPSSASLLLHPPSPLLSV